MILQCEGVHNLCTGVVNRYYYVCCRDGKYAENKSLELLVENDPTSDLPVNSTVHAPLVCMSTSFKMDMWN